MWFVNGKISEIWHFEVECSCGWEDRALQECNPSAQASVDCGGIRSRPSSVWCREFSFEEGSASYGWKR